MADSAIQYQLYNQLCINLINSLVIKANRSNEAMNTYLIAGLGEEAVDKTKPETWRYNMHLAGEYHPVDKPMYVKSMDTLDIIIFSKENLKYHKATAKYYQLGQRGFIELVAQFPMQETLIRGILNPVPIQKVVSAHDFEILNYNKSLVEVNEYSLITNLQNSILAFTDRWYNPQYAIVDELYYTTFLATLTGHLVRSVINLRLAACRTNEAHSYHVRNYLISKGVREKYIDFLTLHQSLYLYRELPYLSRNLGQNEVFKELYDLLLTQRQIPLDDFVMTHELGDLLDNLRPTIRFKRINLNGVGGVGKPVLTLDEILRKQDKLAPGNPVANFEQIEDIRRAMGHSLNSVLKTKVLESAMVDRSNSQAFNLSSTLLEHWVWLVKNNYYKAVVSVQNPKTGEYLSFSAKEALVLMVYTYFKSIGKDIKEVPKFAVFRSPYLVPPTIDQLYNAVDQRRVTKELVTEIFATLPVQEPVISIEAFHRQAYQLFECYQKQEAILSRLGNYKLHGNALMILEMLYSRESFHLLPEGTLYSQWLVDKNLDLTNFSQGEFGLLNASLLAEGTGANLSATTSVRALQEAMIGLLSDFSSYGIQFITEINSSSLRPLELQTVVPADHQLHPKHHEQGVSVVVDPLQLLTKPKIQEEFYPGFIVDNTLLTAKPDATIQLDPFINTSLGSKPIKIVHHIDVFDFEFITDFT